MINHIVYFRCRPVSVGDAMLIMDNAEERRRQILDSQEKVDENA